MELTPEGQRKDGEARLAAYRADEARERKERGELDIELVRTSAYQADLEEFEGRLTEAGIQYSQVEIAFESLGMTAIPLGVFVLKLAEIVVPNLKDIIVAWIQCRADRKLRVRFGDIEVEAATPEETEKLFKIVEEFNRDRLSHKRDKP